MNRLYSARPSLLVIPPEFRHEISLHVSFLSMIGNRFSHLTRHPVTRKGGLFAVLPLSFDFDRVSWEVGTGTYTLQVARVFKI